MNLELSDRNRSGVTLVEMMVSILLLIIIFCCWSAMNNIQAVRKESLRYAAIEKAAGFLDAMATTDSYEDSAFATIPHTFFKWSDGKLVYTAFEGEPGADAIHPLWPDDPNSPIGYRIYQTCDENGCSCWTNGTWGVVSLFSPDKRGIPKQFTELRMLLDSSRGATR